MAIKPAFLQSPTGVRPCVHFPSSPLSLAPNRHIRPLSRAGNVARSRAGGAHLAPQSELRGIVEAWDELIDLVIHLHRRKLQSPCPAAPAIKAETPSATGRDEVQHLLFAFLKQIDGCPPLLQLLSQLRRYAQSQFSRRGRKQNQRATSEFGACKLTSSNFSFASFSF